MNYQLVNIIQVYIYLWVVYVSFSSCLQHRLTFAAVVVPW